MVLNIAYYCPIDANIKNLRCVILHLANIDNFIRVLILGCLSCANHEKALMVRFDGSHIGDRKHSHSDNPHTKVLTENPCIKARTEKFSPTYITTTS